MRSTLAIVAATALSSATALAAPNPGALRQQRSDAAPPDLNLRPKAPANAQTLAILILSGEEAGVPLSQVYADARKAIEANTALNVAPFDVIAVGQREEAIRDCAGDASCFARKVRENASMEVDLLLTASVDRLDDGLLLGLRLVEIGGGQELGAAGDEIPVGMSMAGAMEGQMPSVFPGSVWGQIAGVDITTTPEKAEVTIAGRSCVSPCQLRRLIPGTYEVSIKKSGYISTSEAITLPAKEIVKLQTELAEPEGGVLSSPFFWGGVAAVAVGAAVAVAFAVRPSDRVINVCIADDRALCDQ